MLQNFSLSYVVKYFAPAIDLILTFLQILKEPLQFLYENILRWRTC